MIQVSGSASERSSSRPKTVRTGSTLPLFHIYLIIDHLDHRQDPGQSTASIEQVACMPSEDNSSPPPWGRERTPDHGAGGNAPTRGDGKKKRIRHWTADDRAAHRVFERSRREAFKERLTASRLMRLRQTIAGADPRTQALASQIPSLQNTEPNRLSKHVVVDESITLHRREQERTQYTTRRIDALLTERDELLAELNTWRRGAGMEPRLAADGPIELPEPTPTLLPEGAAAASVDMWNSGSDMSPPICNQDAQLSESISFAGMEAVPRASISGVANVIPSGSMSSTEPLWDGLAVNMPTHDQSRDTGLGVNGIDTSDMTSLRNPRMYDSAFDTLAQDQGSLAIDDHSFYARGPLHSMDSFGFVRNLSRRET